MAGEKPAGSLNRKTSTAKAGAISSIVGVVGKKMVLVRTTVSGAISLAGSLVRKTKKAIAAAIATIAGALSTAWRHPVVLTAIPRNTTLNTRERDVTLQAVVRKTALTTIVREREKS